MVGDRVRVRDAGVDEHGDPLDLLSGRTGTVRRLVRLKLVNRNTVLIELDNVAGLPVVSPLQWRDDVDLEPTS